MCGIAGMAGRADDALVRRMTDALTHRGPDDSGYYVGDAAALGHRRLSIIDIAGGAQPMARDNGALQLVYNGEIYNFQSLRKELEAEGVIFDTRSDTEVLLHACATWGVDALPRLRGMFAFALWDARERSLLLARDPLGVKPLYYAERDGVLYFGSEIKALLAVPELPRRLDPEGLDDYLTYLYTVPPRTCFEGIHQLPPGHYATWKDGRLRIARYWHIDATPLGGSEDEWIARTDTAIHETIDLYQISDVPLGAFLSGGLDSSTIAAHLAEVSPQPVNTFTIGFESEGKLYDESAQAQATADLLGTVHHSLTAPGDVAGLLDTMVSHFDEPFGNPTALLTYRLCEVVREHVKVILSGDGGDESFGGYPRYSGVQWAEAYRRVPRAIRAGVVQPLVSMLPESTRGQHLWRRIREFSAGSLLDPVEMYIAWVTYFDRAQRTALYTPEWATQIAGRESEDFLRGLFADCPDSDPATRAMIVDLQSFLPHNVLQYGDRMSMAHSLEVRVPLADPVLVQTMARAPVDLKLHGGQSKYLLRRCLEGRLPKDTVDRPKLGFNPPMGVWLNTTLKPLVDDYLAPETIARRGLFQADAVARLIADHRSSRRDNTWHLWSLLVLEAWQRAYLD